MSRNPKALRQVAYHGSPHAGIKTFNTDKIGSGEGAQVFGWGLYFAEKEEVARYYARNLTDINGGPVVLDYTSMIPRARYGTVQDGIDSRQALLDEMRIKAGSGDEFSARQVSLLEANIVKLAMRANVYEVTIPDDCEMLLWDKTLDEQSQEVRRALSGMHDHLKALAVAKSNVGAQPTGSAIYGAMVEYFAEGKKNDVFTNPAHYGQKEASLELADLGIKGIKYLDSQSRDADGGSFNFVIFSGDEAQVERVFFSRTGGCQTDSIAFKGWFGGSQVVDANGAALVVFHGTSSSESIGRFSGNAYAGWFTPDSRKANAYTSVSLDDSGDDGAIYPVYLSIKNPLDLSAIDASADFDANALAVAMGVPVQQVQDMFDERAEGPAYWGLIDTPDFCEWVQALGKDGLTIKEDGAITWAALRSEQIKSATGNRGSYCPDNPDIRFSSVRERER